MENIFIVVLLTSISQIMQAKMEKPLYKNPKVSVAQRVDDLLRRMTLEEKVGQISSWYNHKRSAYFHPAVCADNTPLYPFGYGLSYTEFRYSNLILSDTVNVDMKLKIEPGEFKVMIGGSSKDEDLQQVTFNVK